MERPVIHVDPLTVKADGPQRKKLRTCLGIVTCDKGDVTCNNWKQFPVTQKDMIWEDIQKQFKSDLTSKWALAHDKEGEDDKVCEKYGISKEKLNQFCQSHKDPSWEDVRNKAHTIQKQNTYPHMLSREGYDFLEKKLMEEKQKKRLEEAAQSGSIDTLVDHPSPIRWHMKWNMARTKKTGQITYEATKEIADRIDSLEKQASQGSFVAHGRQDVLTTAIGQPEHPGCVRAVRAGVMIKNYFGPASRDSCISSSMALEESITEKVTHQLMASFNQMQSQFQSQMQSQGLALPPEPLVGPLGPRVSTKESYVDPSRNDPETGDSERCGLYIEANSDRLVALGRVYEGSIVVHNTRLLPGKVKVSVEEVKDSDAPVLYPLMSGAGNSHFLCLADTSGQAFITAVVSLAKPPEKPDLEVDDPLYLMTLTIPELFLRPYQVTWDAAVFKVFNPDFLLYIKHEDLFEIAHGGQCLSISVLQLWILALKGLDDAPHPKSKAPTRWIVVKYFNDPKPLEPKRLKALRIQWTQYYLQVRAQS
ncbi:hypothetical protein GmHk_06G017451 [Glycine max]|nr:hypothetical protein GmHk_06G017451 [Glycine max]